MTKATKWYVRPAKTQISLGIRPVWSEYSLPAWRKLSSLATHWAHSEDSDQTGRMLRLIWVFAGRTVILLVLSRGGSFRKFRQLKHPTSILVYMPIPSGSQSRHHWVHKLPIISYLVTNHMKTTLYLAVFAVSAQPPNIYTAVYNGARENTQLLNAFKK